MAKEDKFADEMLTDDELDQISGGSLQQSADDSHYLNDILYGTQYYKCDQYGKTSIFLNQSLNTSGPTPRLDISNAWGSLGISCTLNKFEGNTYKYKGEIISRRRAYEIAWEKAGRNMNDLPPSWGT